MKKIISNKVKPLMNILPLFTLILLRASRKTVWPFTGRLRGLLLLIFMLTVRRSANGMIQTVPWCSAMRSRDWEAIRSSFMRWVMRAMPGLTYNIRPWAIRPGWSFQPRRRNMPRDWSSRRKNSGDGSFPAVFYIRISYQVRVQKSAFSSKEALLIY